MRLILSALGLVTAILMISFLLIKATSQHRNIFALRDILSGDYCDKPCWQHIVPGETDLESLQPILDHATGEINVLNRLTGAEGSYEWEYDDELLMPPPSQRRTLVFVVFSDDSIISQVSAAISVCVSSIIREYDFPDSIRVSADSFNTYYDLMYPKDGFSFLLSEYDLPRATSVVRASQDYFQTNRDIFSWDELQSMFVGECADSFSS